MKISTTVLIAVASLVAATGLAVACSDAAITPAASPSFVERPVSPAPAHAGGAASSKGDEQPERVTAAEFHRRNPMDWVGVMHNRGLDVFRAELRSRKHRNLQQLCRDLIDLALRDSLSPAEHRRMSVDQRRALVEQGLSTTPGCRSVAAGQSSQLPFAPMSAGSGIVRFASYSESGMGAALQTADVQALLNRISYAVSVASDPNSLASQLDQIVSSAASLDASARDAVYGAASLALSSVEYWNANYPSFEAEVEAEYGCAGGRTCEEPYSVLGAANRRQFWSGAWRAARTIGGYDLTAGVAVIMKTWLAGPIGWEAAGDAALVGSAVGAVGYVIRQIQQY
jgi:hypothetical protein